MKTTLFASIFTLALLSSCAPKSAPQQEQQQAPLVKTAKSHTAMVSQTVSFTGTIEPNQQNTICPSAVMRIDEILVDVGDQVKKGDLIVKMDPTAYRQTAVQLAQLETDYERMKSVYEAKGISKQQLDAQKVQVEVSRESAENLLQNTELHSPINGVVTERFYDPGDMFMLSAVNGVIGLVTIMEIDRLKVNIQVSESYFPQVKKGMEAIISLDIYEEPFIGKVTRISPAINPSTRTFGVEIVLPNNHHKLRPGMFARVGLNFGDQERVLIPDLAVQNQAGTNQRYVYTLQEDSVVVRSSVELGRRIDNYYEVLSGVESGDELVVAGASRLQDSIQVTVIK